MSYQSKYTGAEIDYSIEKTQNIFVKKNEVIPVEVGGTGQTTIAGIKNMLGLDEEQQSVIQISGGGTGATTAADARTKLGITPDNIGAAKAPEHLMKTYTDLRQIGLTGAPTMDEIVEALPNDSVLRFVPSPTAYSAGITTSNVPALYGSVHLWKINGTRWGISFYPKAGSQIRWAGILKEESGGVKFDKWVKAPNEETLGPMVQSLLQGGKISVVKSVQRGTVSVSGSKIITINSVNMNKAVVLINQDAATGALAYVTAGSGRDSYGIGGGYLKSSTQLEIKNTASDVTNTFYWQVVEYY